MHSSLMVGRAPTIMIGLFREKMRQNHGCSCVFRENAALKVDLDVSILKECHRSYCDRPGKKAVTLFFNVAS